MGRASPYCSKRRVGRGSPNGAMVMDGNGRDGQDADRQGAGTGTGAPAEASKADPRKARLAAALRENLRRRKAQVRERRGPGET